MYNSRNTFVVVGNYGKTSNTTQYVPTLIENLLDCITGKIDLKQIKESVLFHQKSETNNSIYEFPYGDIWKTIDKRFKCSRHYNRKFEIGDMEVIIDDLKFSIPLMIENTKETSYYNASTLYLNNYKLVWIRTDTHHHLFGIGKNIEELNDLLAILVIGL